MKRRKKNNLKPPYSTGNSHGSTEFNNYLRENGINLEDEPIEDMDKQVEDIIKGLDIKTNGINVIINPEPELELNRIIAQANIAADETPVPDSNP